MAIVNEREDLDQPVSFLAAEDTKATAELRHLAAAGRSTEVQSRFEELCLEGLASGPSIVMTDAAWDSFRAELQNEA